ncbi:MAG TPA: AAA family ATPase, partial [Acidobacteriota bacterium]|nr:AAA family ATPase [Acidobacteriota bacterium]
LLKTDLNAKSSTPEVAKKFEQQLIEVIAVLKNILPDIQDIRIPQLTSVKERARVEFQTPYGWVSVRSLGIGHRTMIAWVVDLARRLFERYPDSPDPLAEPAIVLVDEIDLHLHPKWQRQIITYLSERFPNTQFIVTAHSPLIVQAAVSVKANIVVLKREGDHVVIEQNVEVVRGWRVDQILTSDLFELESARPPDWDQLFARREALLSQTSLSESEIAELKSIRQKISELPTGETLQELEAMDLIRRAAQELKQRGFNQSDSHS